MPVSVDEPEPRLGVSERILIEDAKRMPYWPSREQVVYDINDVGVNDSPRRVNAEFCPATQLKINHNIEYPTLQIPRRSPVCFASITVCVNDIRTSSDAVHQRLLWHSVPRNTFILPSPSIPYFLAGYSFRRFGLFQAMGSRWGAGEDSEEGVKGGRE